MYGILPHKEHRTNLLIKVTGVVFSTTVHNTLDQSLVARQVAGPSVSVYGCRLRLLAEYT